MKPLLTLLLLAALVLVTAGCIQPQIPDPHPTPLPTAPPPSGEHAFLISNTDQYLSYWNEKMGWDLTDRTRLEYAEELNRYLDATWEKEAAGYHVTNTSDFLRAVKTILGLTEEQFAAFVTADSEQKRADQLNYHSHTSRLYETETIPESATVPLQNVPIYDPAEFTITACGPDLSPEDLFESANDTLNNYTTLFGKIAAPGALSNSFLPESSLSLQKTLSKNVSSASPMPDGYLGISPVTLADDEKLAAYGFRVLPTGQTMTYVSIVSADANDAAYAAAEDGLNEWMTTVHEKTIAAGTSIISNAAEVSSISEPGLLSSLRTSKDYGICGKIDLYSTWYWDPIEQNRYQDQFYATSEITMTPGKVTHGNSYKNHKFTLTIDPGYSDLSRNAPHLPGAVTTSPAPTGTSSGHSVTCSLRLSRNGALSWTTDIPDTSLVFTNPSGKTQKWEGTFNSLGTMAGQTFIFQAGVIIESTQSTSRNGNVYTLSKNTVDAYHAFSEGLVSFGPTTNRYIPQELYIQWKNVEYKPFTPDV